jgi:hypothetical protein
MEFCSRQCIRRTLHAVLIGISPIVLCLLLIVIARIILFCFECAYYRRQKPLTRSHSSTIFQQSGRPTLSYTPISIEEIQRIIQGHYHRQQQGDSHHGSPKAAHFMKSIFTRRESSPEIPPSTLSSLVARRNAIDTTPFAALIAPLTVPSYDCVNERIPRRGSIMKIKHESVEKTTLSTKNNSRDSIFYNANDTIECESTDTDPLVKLRKATTTTTVVVEEILDFQSVRSVPCSLNLGNSFEDDED